MTTDARPVQESEIPENQIRDPDDVALDPGCLTVTRSSETTPIGAAIRDEIRKLADADTLTLARLRDIARVARDGRQLLAVRNPLARFDARAQGLETIPTRFSCIPHPMEGHYDHWNGGAVRGAEEARAREIEAALKESPLANAVKLELLDCTSREPFGPSTLLEIEQLVTQAHAVLTAALGLPEPPSPNAHPRRLRGFGAGSAIPYANPMMNQADVAEAWCDDDAFDGSSSSETFGAKVARELVAGRSKEDPLEGLISSLALAREKGLDDVATKIEAKLNAALGGE